MNANMRRAYWLRRWATALRTTNARQITRFRADEAGGMCAQGVFLDDLSHDGLVGSNWRIAWRQATPDVKLIESTVGVGYWIVAMGRNDFGDNSFAQIADYLDDEADALCPRPVVEMTPDLIGVGA